MELLPSQSFFIYYDDHKRSNAINKKIFLLKEVDLEKLKLTIRLALERNLSFREVFVRINDVYKVLILDTDQMIQEAIKEEERDFSNLSKEQIKVELDELGDKIIEGLHSFEGKVLARFVIIKDTKAKKNYLVVVFHHLIYDGFSLNLIFKDLEKIYTSLISNQPLSLPEIGVSIKEYQEYTEKLVEKYKFDPKINGSFSYYQNLQNRNILPFYFPPCEGTQKPGYTRFHMTSVPSSFIHQLENASSKYNSKAHIVAMYFYIKMAMEKTKQREGTVFNFVNNRRPFEEFNKSIEHLTSFIAGGKYVDFSFKTDSLEQNLEEIKTKLTSGKALSLDFLTLDKHNYEQIAHKYTQHPLIYFNYVYYADNQSSSFISESLVKGQQVGYYKAFHQHPQNFIKLFFMNYHRDGQWLISFVYNETFFSPNAIKQISDEYLYRLKQFISPSSL